MSATQIYAHIQHAYTHTHKQTHSSYNVGNASLLHLILAHTYIDKRGVLEVYIDGNLLKHTRHKPLLLIVLYKSVMVRFSFQLLFQLCSGSTVCFVEKSNISSSYREQLQVDGKKIYFFSLLNRNKIAFYTIYSFC